jgi:hypothetical protein
MKPSARLLVSVSAAAAILGSAAPAQADIILPGTYRLFNHRAGNVAPPFYGLRLDELFDVSPGHDIFTFDFESPGNEIFLNYDAVAGTIHIFGQVFGGHDDGADYSVVPGRTSVAMIDFTYENVHLAPGDDDLIVTTPTATNTGTLTWVETGEVIQLWDKANAQGFTFRFGDEDNDLGHRGFNGLSGWGWLNHRDPNLHIAASDWLFTGEFLPAAPVTALFGLGLFAAGRRRRRC